MNEKAASVLWSRRLFERHLLEAGADVALEGVAFGGGDALGIETVAIVQAEDGLEGFPNFRERGVGGGSMEPDGQGFRWITRGEMQSEFVLEFVEFGVEAGACGGGLLIRLRGVLAGTAFAKNDLIEEDRQNRHEGPEQILAQMGLAPAEF